MKVEKKKIGDLIKCYAIAPLHYQGKEHFLVAAEKQDRCLLFDLDGKQQDTVWSEPGGVMSMVQIPGSDGQFLATHKFYSPNDSKEAKIVIVSPQKKGDWEIKTLINLPHVHRFDIIIQDDIRYLIACTLKSGHKHMDDWSMPGKVYAAILPDDLSCYNEDNQLPLEVIKDNMLKNHGYYKVVEDGLQTSIISCDSGVYQFFPPVKKGGRWKIKQILDTAASDAVLIDLDGDDVKELAVLSPFHGPDISIYKNINGSFKKVYTYEKPAFFSHALFAGLLCNKPTVVVGHRQGTRDLLALTWNAKESAYQTRIIDKNCGSANVYHYTHQGKDIIISANRETNEIAMYRLEP